MNLGRLFQMIRMISGLLSKWVTQRWVQRTLSHSVTSTTFLTTYLSLALVLLVSAAVAGGRAASALVVSLLMVPRELFARSRSASIEFSADSAPMLDDRDFVVNFRNKRKWEFANFNFLSNFFTQKKREHFSHNKKCVCGTLICS